MTKRQTRTDNLEKSFSTDKSTDKSTPKTSQRARFIETARELGADKDADALDRVFGKVVPPVSPEKPEVEQKK